jgi:hypothetical protein
MPVKALAGAVARGITAPLNGLWRLLSGWVEGRQMRLFERERRTTLVCVPPTLAVGTMIYDRRADGSVLLIAIPAGSSPDRDGGRRVSQDTAAAERCISGGHPVDGIGGRAPHEPAR